MVVVLKESSFSVPFTGAWQEWRTGRCELVKGGERGLRMCGLGDKLEFLRMGVYNRWEGSHVSRHERHSIAHL